MAEQLKAEKTTSTSMTTQFGSCELFTNTSTPASSVRMTPKPTTRYYNPMALVPTESTICTPSRTVDEVTSCSEEDVSSQQLEIQEMVLMRSERQKPEGGQKNMALQSKEVEKREPGMKNGVDVPTRHSSSIPNRYFYLFI